MTQDSSKTFIEQARRQLDAHADVVDELTAARLGAARRRALAGSSAARAWWPLAGLATAAAVALVSFLLVQQPHEPASPTDLWVAGDDFELIEDLDFYAWLEETESNS